jgi:hypothetical protein
MKLYINKHSDDVGERRLPQWWSNFVESVGLTKWPDEVLPNYNASFGIDDNEDMYLLFNHDSDATYFLLLWS